MVTDRNLPVLSFDDPEPGKQIDLDKVQRISIEKEKKKPQPIEEMDIDEIVP